MRTKIGRCYVQRSRNGQFKKFTLIGKSLSADKKRRSNKVYRSGYGNTSDSYTLMGQRF